MERCGEGVAGMVPAKGIRSDGGRGYRGQVEIVAGQGRLVPVDAQRFQE